MQFECPRTRLGNVIPNLGTVFTSTTEGLLESEAQFRNEASRFF